MSGETRAVAAARADAPVVAAGRISPARRLVWSVRRELWENPAFYVAPLLASAALCIGQAFGMAGLAQRRRAVLLLDPLQQRVHIERTYDIATGMILIVGLLVWLFYCLDALHGERRDRSILFWKSLPVSDGVTVLSKLVMPLTVLPAITFVVIVFTHLVLMLMSTAVLMANGLPPATASQLPLVSNWLNLLYSLVVMVLWDAPFYGWLLLVSGWARRAALLWAFLPFVVLSATERLIFQTTYVEAILRYRALGWTWEAFTGRPRGTLLIDPLNHPAPVHFLGTPGLWIGLLLATLFVAAAIQLRRHRSPL